MSFEQYDLSPDLLNGLVDTRIEKPTPLQQEVIPQALEGKHLLVKNESEDNGAFLIPALQKLIAN
ncbi:MAG: ATP-dependent helicase, partial [Balneola sp.]